MLKRISSASLLLWRAATLTVLMASAALAQGDPRADYGPAKSATAAAIPAPKPEATADTKAQPKQEAKAEAKPKAAAKPTAKIESQPTAKAETKPTAKSTTKSTTKPEAKRKPAARRKKEAVAMPAARPVTARSGDAGGGDVAKPSLAETYAAIPLAERMAIQDDLVWTGDYAGSIDGQYSERLVEAVKSYQKRRKDPATGVLSADQRATLDAAVTPRKQEVGWRLVDDPVTDVRLGIPARLATKIDPGPNGTRWSSAQGQLQIETFRIDTGASLEAVFEQQKKLPRRRISSSSMQGDSFVIAGMQGLKKLVVRGFARDGEIRGLTVLYDQAMAGTMDPLMPPMASAFVPFAGPALAGASTVGRRKVEYGTGIVVSAAGLVLTARALVDNCHVVVLPGLGNAERVATDPSGELALLRVYGARNLTPLALGGDSSGDSVTLAGIADPQSQGGGDAVSTVKAQLGAATATGARSLAAMPALGFAGAAAIDGDGNVAGMAVLRTLLLAGPASGASRAAVVPAARIRDFLEANNIKVIPKPPGIEAAKASLVRVICVRR